MAQILQGALAAITLSSTALIMAACSPANNSASVAQSGTVIASGTASIGGPFTLTDTSGKIFTQDNLKGKPSLIYFGFSYCPDVCPTALQKMGALQAQMGKDGEKLRYIFISVDTERDTPETLAPYVTSRGFPKPLVGLSGTQEQMDQAVAAYRVYAQKVKDDSSAAEFTYDHSDLIIVTDGQGEFANIFTRDASLTQMAESLKALL